MKKLVVSMMIILMILSIGVTTYAQELSNTEQGTEGADTAKTPRVEVKIKPEKSEDEKTITLTLSLGKFTNVKENAMLGYEAKLDYKDEIFETVEAKDVKGLNGWTATYSPTTKALIGDPIIGKENTDITEITLHLKDGVEAESTTVGLTEFLLSDDDENDLYALDLPISISIKKEEPSTPPEGQGTQKEPSKSEETKAPDKNLTTIPTDGTIAKASSLPKAGNTVLIMLIVAILVIIAFGVVSGKGYIRYLKDTHKQIKK